MFSARFPTYLVGLTPDGSVYRANWPFSSYVALKCQAKLFEVNPLELEDITKFFTKVAKDALKRQKAKAEAEAKAKTSCFGLM